MHIISFSGGIGSAVSAIIARNLHINFELVFADTLIEDEDLYRFIIEVSDYLKKPIHWLKDGRNPWEVFADKKYIGNSRTAHCSKILKTNQVKLWAEKHANISDPLVLGMYGDEMERLGSAQVNWHPRPVISLLALTRTTPIKADRLLRETGIKKPRLYDMGFPHNNCGGFCVRAGQGQFATLLKAFPDRYKYHEKQNIETEAKIKRAAGFIRVQENYLNMRDFREKVESGEISPKIYEMGGCGCFVDDK
jgi:hypothetical protein